MLKTKITERCSFCMARKEVVKVVFRQIPGYKNNITNNDTAMVEILTCGHELIDGKFDPNSIYFIAPKKMPNTEHQAIPLFFNITPVQRKQGKFQLMDILCGICLITLSFLCPPLIALPILYFVFRAKEM